MSAITRGVYIHFTEAELATEWANYKAAVKAQGTSHGRRITSGSVGGKSFTYEYPEGVGSIAEWRAALVDAQNQLLGITTPPSNKTVMRF